MTIDDASVVSKAALAKLELPFSQLESDLLLHLICTIAPPNQLSVIKASKGTRTTLAINDGTTTLNQRNAIIRTLCGMTLHNALDGSTCYLLGGHAALINPESPIVIAAISSWMSVADALRSPGRDFRPIANHLNNEVLNKNSFLVKSVPTPTVADLDVFFALIQCIQSSPTSDIINNSLNLKRWFVQCHKIVREMLSRIPTKKGQIPEMSIPEMSDMYIDESPMPIPIFFFEDTDDVNIKTLNNGLKIPESSGDAKKDSKERNIQVLSEVRSEGVVAAENLVNKKNQKAEKKKSKSSGNQDKQGKSKSTPASSESLDISALDIRVGKIVEVWEHESSDKLWCEKIDIGEKEPRQILSGLRHFYKREEMESQGLVLVLCNLKKRNLGGVPSHGMVLCASNTNHTEVEFVVPPPKAKVGERVMFDGYDGNPEPENKVAKKKLHEKLLPDLKTDSNGVVVWKESKSITSVGECVASKGAKHRLVG